MTVDELAALHAKCFTQPRPWTATEFSDLLNSPAVFLCADEHGFAMGRIAGPETELLTIAVDPDFRRQGIAQSLMAQFEATAMTKQSEELFLEVAETNLAALKLYQCTGFQHVGIRKDYYASPTGQRITAVVMRKQL